jgi:hypothetical protein
MNGSAVAGATSSTFTTTASSVSQLQSISVSAYTNASCVSNTYATGSAQYIPFTVNAVVTPSVSISSSSTNIFAGTSVTFTATPINGGSSPSYAWYVNGSQVSSGSSNTFSSSSLSNGQQVSCVMSSSASCATPSSATSNTITMTVNPVVTMGVTISGNTNVCQGTPASFAATVTSGTGTITFHWKKNGADVVSDGQGVPPNGLVLNSVNNNDVITCVITTTGCASPATSNALTLSNIVPENFIVDAAPTQISYCQDAQVTFNAVSSLPTYNYQWYVNGSPVTGATSSTFVTPASSVAYLQSISVSASTSATCVNNTTSTGSAQYVPFSVNPWITPSVNIIEPLVVKLGSPATFTADPINTATPTYQWQVNGVNISGATGNTFTTTVTSGEQYQTIGLIMTAHEACTVTPSVTTNWVEISSSKWENLNYVRIHDVAASNVSNWVQVDGLYTGDKFQSTTYLDGSARPIQKVEKEMSQLESGAWVDMVTHIEYDAAGRTGKSFVPYASSSTIGQFKSSAPSEQGTFVRNKYGEDANAPTYVNLNLESNPLSRVLNAKMPGTAFGGDANYSGVINTI